MFPSDEEKGNQRIFPSGTPLLKRDFGYGCFKSVYILKGEVCKTGGE